MLFLLRNIRRKLLTGNKVTTYLLYAIGEIFLVVMGILIAVSIDEWNENRQTRKLEIKYLKELRANLEFDLNDIDFNIGFNQDRFNSTKTILTHLRNRWPYHDSLDFHFSNIPFSTITVPNTNAYESLKSKGFEIISSDSLRAEITELYTFSYKYIMDFETVDDHAHQWSVVWPEVMRTVEIDSLTVSATPLNFENLQDDASFKNMLTTNLTLRGHMIAQYKMLRKKVINLIRHIDRELKKLE